MAAAAPHSSVTNGGLQNAAKDASRVQGACTPLRIDTGASPAAGAPPIDYTNQSATLRPTCDRPLCRTLFRLLRITRKGAARRNCLL
mmetsp:Transcript_18001/g.54181  ORF Transcript_18001/g.54181 Transcript_18001/m.54181 type:complete len:87 (+) Transcript_18001:998-1258(+)